MLKEKDKFEKVRGFGWNNGKVLRTNVTDTVGKEECADEGFVGDVVFRALNMGERSR